MKDKFNYWSEEHYETKVVTGSLQVCMAIYEAEKREYPAIQYGTHIAFKSDTSAKYKVVIRRFKTAELARQHALYPPTYVREEQSND